MTEQVSSYCFGVPVEFEHFQRSYFLVFRVGAQSFVCAAIEANTQAFKDLKEVTLEPECTTLCVEG